MINPNAASSIHCLGVGTTQKNDAAAKDNTVPIELLMIRICSGDSKELSFLIKITSIPKKRAAPKARAAAQWKLSSPGLKSINAPPKEINAASHRVLPTFSFKTGIATNIAITGFMKDIAIASEIGMNITAANMELTPSHPRIDLPK